ncbi:hypothetical protein JCM33374_g5597 [Metschnikowia sp. JCM 33374]|nr:hypothetical protein JCM33374_g5597 [Metschnikowia sp. JCM 33374]
MGAKQTLSWYNNQHYHRNEPITNTPAANTSLNTTKEFLESIVCSAITALEHREAITTAITEVIVPTIVNHHQHRVGNNTAVGNNTVIAIHYNWSFSSPQHSDCAATRPKGAQTHAQTQIAHFEQSISAFTSELHRKLMVMEPEHLAECVSRCYLPVPVAAASKDKSVSVDEIVQLAIKVDGTLKLKSEDGSPFELILGVKGQFFSAGSVAKSRFIIGRHEQETASEELVSGLDDQCFCGGGIH